MRNVIATHIYASVIRVIGSVSEKTPRLAHAFGVGALVAFALVTAILPSTVWAQQGLSTQPVSRPFPFIQVQVGDVPVALPKDWVETKFIDVSAGQQKSIAFVNSNLRRPPRSTHFDVPPLRLFDMVAVAQSLATENIRSRNKLLNERSLERVADTDGFWRWKPNEYVLVSSTYARPLGQVLLVSCARSLRPNQSGEQRCLVAFYATPETWVRYAFYDSDVPKSHWVELDQRVLALLNFLDGRKAWSSERPN